MTTKSELLEIIKNLDNAAASLNLGDSKESIVDLTARITEMVNTVDDNELTNLSGIPSGGLNPNKLAAGDGNAFTCCNGKEKII